MNLNKLRKITFDKECTMTCGKKGHGKDMLFANVIARAKKPYISNTDYKCKDSQFIPLDLNKLDCLNDYHNFISGKINPYEYPYPENVDCFISDCGVYFPSQYDTKLDKEYPHLPNTFILYRQLANARIHTNSQTLSRVYKKLREHADTFILCNWCKVLFKSIVIQKITVYDRMEACEKEVEPYLHIKIPLLASKETKAHLTMKDEEMKRLFKQEYGRVKSYILIYKNITNYDTRIFKSILKGDKNNIE